MRRMEIVYQIPERGARVCTKKFFGGVEDVANVEMLPVPMLPMGRARGVCGAARGMKLPFLRFVECAVRV